MTYANAITVLVLLGIIPTALFVFLYRPPRWSWIAFDALAWPLALLSIFLLALLGQLPIDTTTWAWRAVRLCLALGLNVLAWSRLIGYIRFKPKRERRET